MQYEQQSQAYCHCATGVLSYSTPGNRVVAVPVGAVRVMLPKLEAPYVILLSHYRVRAFQLSQHTVDSLKMHSHNTIARYATTLTHFPLQPGALQPTVLPCVLIMCQSC